MPKIPDDLVVIGLGVNSDTTGGGLDAIRPYTFHGLDLTGRGTHRLATCPFCGRDGKFSVDVATGLWRCFVCASGTENGGGNAVTFLRLLWERAERDAVPLQHLASARKLLDWRTPLVWGARTSPVDGGWLLPGFAADGRMIQLYRWVRDHKSGKNILLATSGHPHGLFGVDQYDPAKPDLWHFEGPWDAMAAWEVAAKAKRSDGGFELTGSPQASVLGCTNFLAAPGCNVFNKEWLPLFKGKRVTIFYDSDHPKIVGQRTMMAGWDGARRVVGALHGAAESVEVLQWGPDGYDPALPSGTDVRDILSRGASMTDRFEMLRQVAARIALPPAHWVNDARDGHNFSREIEAKPCQSWSQVEGSWQEAMRWRQCLGDVLSICLAVCASTSQTGNQLFLQLIGDAGSGKSAFCDAMLVSPRCFALEHLTGFHSGWKGENGEDCSLIGRINHKTLITPEGDVLMSSPKFIEIMSQQRRIFDGTSGASYKNTSEDKRWTNLRTPWIIAGTPALMDTDQSRLGDRFLRAVIDCPSKDEQQRILEYVWRSAFRSVGVTSNGDGASTVDGPLLEAYRLTGGYVNWLRDNMEELVARVLSATDVAVIGPQCGRLAELTADLRARPNPDPRKLEVNDSKEMPTRLTHQYVRLACCLAVVLNRPRVDADVMRRVRKVAVDTSRGRSLDLVRYFHMTHPRTRKICQEDGIMTGELHQWTGIEEIKLINYLTFLRKIGVAQLAAQPGSRGTWRLTERVCGLYQSFTGEQ